MATKVIREFVAVRPNLQIPNMLQERLNKKRLSKNSYQLFADYLKSIGEVETADKVAKEAKLNKIKEAVVTKEVKNKVEDNIINKEINEEIDGSIQDAIEDGVERGVQEAIAKSVEPIAKSVEPIDMTQVKDEVMELVKMQNQKIDVLTKMFETYQEKINHLDTIIEMMSKTEMTKTDARTKVSTDPRKTPMPFERFAMRSRLAK